MIDLGDFINVVMNNRTTLDLEQLKRLADAVHPHGGAKALRIIADIDAGRRIQLP